MSDLCKCQKSKSPDSTANWLASDRQMDNLMGAMPERIDNAIALKFKSILAQLRQGISAALTNFVRNEPRVWEWRDSYGRVWWSVYDPKTERYACLSSQAEVLQWLEERFYR